MKTKVTTVAEYIKELPEERRAAFKKLRTTIKKNIPKGFREIMQYDMVGYAVPLSTYSPGYHCTPDTPLPFIHIANQKGSINLYHMGIYANKKLFTWFTKEYPKYVKTNLDMGKCCIRFKNMDTIPYELIAQLVQKMTVDQWVTLYEGRLKK